MSEVTELLQQAGEGDAAARERLLQSVYEELRTIAAYYFSGEREGHSLQPTALVNEAYLRLISGGKLQQFDNRSHFFSAAAEAMRRILVDSARARTTIKRGGDFQRVELGDLGAGRPGDEDLLLDLDEGIRLLSEQDAISAELIKLRVFAGLSVTEAGEVLGLSRTSAYQTWHFGRSWFGVYLRD